MQQLAWPVAILPRVVVAGRFALADTGFATTYLGRTHALHLHDYQGRMRLAGGMQPLGPGDLTLSPAGQPSSYDLADSGHHWCIHFAPVEAADGAIVLPLHLHLAAAASAARERMAHVASLHARGGASPVAAAGASLALQELLLWLWERTAPMPAGAARAERAAALIDARFAEPLTIAGIARELGCARAHLARQFRAHFGNTLAHRLIERRMAHARYLLEATDLPIWRVAERSGIPDPQHFNKLARRFLGASPSAVRAAANDSLGIDPDR
ncbi:helix-turn-helix transcriptional regulator [Sphingosinicella sp. LHD-64]|uniref:helix-turn-helix transcriptional regulator n=1 Tax=Sphingosinicella sp. LHD-64 TaxID=3072139 RepID=UPI00280D50DA|nr:helix-turn-helix transcriptional regulator [Sphingosinicella sp. LHD-64]MDQ8757117.1 helix-turn-helix transcriptional regulator [Sphingosinicella sp. LHD-64]